MDLYKKLKNLKIGKIEKDVDIKKITTYRVGGVASYMVFPKNVDKLILLLKLLKEEKIKYMIIGNGYTKGHAEITLQILRESEIVRTTFEKMYL